MNTELLLNVIQSTSTKLSVMIALTLLIASATKVAIVFLLLKMKQSSVVEEQPDGTRRTVFNGSKDGIDDLANYISSVRNITKKHNQ